MPTLTTKIKNTIRRQINKHVFNYCCRTYERRVGNIRYVIEDANELFFLGRRIKHGLGYDLDVIKTQWKKTDKATVLDLGCNSGAFCLWLLYKLGGKNFNPSIFVVDADAEYALRAQNNLKLNNLTTIGYHGAIGGKFDNTDNKKTFYIGSSSEGNSIYKGLLPDDDVDPMEATVPVVDPWDIIYPSHRLIDMMKVDIEGAELGFITDYAQQLAGSVKFLIVEWHEPVTSGAWLIKTLTTKNKFICVNHDNLNQRCGNAYFINPSLMD